MGTLGHGASRPKHLWAFSRRRHAEELRTSTCVGLLLSGAWATSETRGRLAWLGSKVRSVAESVLDFAEAEVVASIEGDYVPIAHDDRLKADETCI